MQDTEATQAAQADDATKTAAPAAVEKGGPTGDDTSAVAIDKSKPDDFEGEVTTNDALPSAETIRKIEDYPVLDKDGKTAKFKDLYSGEQAARRVLMIFIRHFFCGNCQDYLRTLAESITPEALAQLPASTSIAVVGCGDPALIEMYVEATGCRFPIYTDPTRALFDELGMTKTLAMGSKPAYTRKSAWRSALESIAQGLRTVPKGLALKSGDHRQVGGEFLFEPRDETGGDGDGGTGEKRVSWCHRMRSTRDHTEVPAVEAVLGLKGSGSDQ